MILDSMLSHSPVFLFLVSAFLLATYGATRLIQACIRQGMHWLSQQRRHFTAH